MTHKQNETDLLRQAAEAQFLHAPHHTKKLMQRPAEKLLHELQVHQIELEMQNEALRQSQIELEKSRDRYVDFYDLAPVGYLTLNHEGMIDEINLTGATLLGVERNKLPHRRFAPFVAAEDRDRWHRHLMHVLKRDNTLPCELALQRGDGSRFYARLDCLRLSKAGKTPIVRIALTDITEHMNNEQVLRESEERFRKITESAQDAIIIMGADQRISFWNAAAENIFGYTADEANGHELHTLIAPAAAHAKFSLAFPRFQKTGEGPIIGKVRELTALRRGGEEFPAELSISTTQLNGQWHAIGIVRDITERKKFEVALRIASTAFESQESMMITDTNGVILRVNQAFTAATGYTAEEVVGQTPRILKSGRHDDDFYRDMWETVQHSGKWQGEVWDRRKNGEVYPKLLTISAVKDSDGVATHYVGVDHDITKRKAAEEEINNMAFYDSLTLLPNRRLFNDRLNKTMAASARSGRFCAVMFLDLDNFKPLNDLHGHDVGDLLLVEVAHRLAFCVRKVDTVARFGGDEFVVMLSELDQDKAESTSQAAIVAEKIRIALAEPYLLKIHHKKKTETTVEYYCSSSIGVIMFINHEAGMEDIIKCADMAMYQAKEAGRNQIRFYEGKV